MNATAIATQPRQKFEVDLQRIAESKGLKIYSAQLPKSISGMLVHRPEYKTESGFVIFTESREPAVRQRFTAAHEIGHFDLHRDLIGTRIRDNYLLRSDGLSSRGEVEANKYAADLLMPYDLIDEAMAQGIRSPRELAKAFGVSEIAMAIRLGMPT